MERCLRCHYESITTCKCGVKICGYSHCERVYNGPWPSYRGYHIICCNNCGKKYKNEFLLERKDIEIKNLISENSRLIELLKLHNIDINVLIDVEEK